MARNRELGNFSARVYQSGVSVRRYVFAPLFGAALTALGCDYLNGAENMLQHTLLVEATELAGAAFGVATLIQAIALSANVAAGWGSVRRNEMLNLIWPYSPLY
jgi:hypothetical protein